MASLGKAFAQNLMSSVANSRGNVITKGEKMDIREIIKASIKSISGELTLIRLKSRALPENPKLSQENQHGHLRLVSTYYENGVRHRRNLKPDSVESKKTIAKLVLDYQQKQHQHNYAVISSALNQLKDASLDGAVSSLLQKYPFLTADHIADALSYMHSKDADAFKDFPYKECNYRLEDRTQITSRGFKVRSKSEVSIVEGLFHHKLPLLYEPQITIDDQTLIPDFVIRRRDGKIFYWEHFGLVNDPEYVKRMHAKLLKYQKAGIVPWDNLIMTFDNSEGSIDMQQIENIIKTFLLV